MTDLNRLSALEAAKRIGAGTLTSEALTRACLERIAAREPQVKAWEFIDPAAALEQARRCDRGPRRGLLHGLPVGVKDMLDTADMPTIWGNETTYAGRRPERNAPAVIRLREEGGFVLGKTAISWYGYWWPRQTRNPHDLSRTPGSSSSGSAAAIADFMCPLALGTQTVGSIMRPAAFCGIAGFKPSHDWFPMRNVRDYAPSLDVLGLLARSVQDIQFFMRAMTGRPVYDPEKIEGGQPKIGLYRTADWTKAPDYTRASYEETASRLRKAGCEVRDVVLPAHYDRLADDIEIVGSYESARSFEWELTNRVDQLGEGLRELLEEGLHCPRERYLAAWDHGEQCRRTFAEDIGDVDLLMVPGALGEAPDASTTGQNPFIGMWTILYVPDISIPAGKGPSGLPLGVQLIGRRGDDAAHLERARRIEQLLSQ